MSSFLGHAIIGAALGCHALQHNQSRQQHRIIILLFIALSISPDIDYAVFWLFSYHITPRYTHSIGFCLCIGLLARLLNRQYGKADFQMPCYLMIFAPLSHLVLDYAVGVHQNPIFWPMSSQLVAASYGVLPSAGKLSLTNYYLWRNLLVELSILLPIAIYIAMPKYRISPHNALLLFAIFGIACIVGIRLHH